MYQVFMKVYGAFHPTDLSVDKALSSLQPQIVGDSPWFYRTNDMINISYEGIWFPVEDALDLLTQTLSPESIGKVDVLDLDAWTLTRHQWQDGQFQSSPARDLNSVLDYSGH